jgi:hypothetical protein
MHRSIAARSRKRHLPDVDTHHVSGLDRAAAERDFKVPVNPHPWYKLLG